MTVARAKAVTKWTYAKAKKEAEARVVRWQWSTDAIASLEPCHFEIELGTRGKLLAKPPRAPKNVVEQGFDENGELAVERSYTTLPGRCYETFYARRPGGIARRHFTYEPTKKAINTSYLTLRGDRVTRIDTLYAGTNQKSVVYTYDARGKLARVSREGPGAHRDRLDVEWSGDTVMRVWRVDGTDRSVHFERAPRAASLASQAKALEAGLTKAILAALRAAKIDEEVYAVALYWTGAGYEHRLPPDVAVARASFRDRIAKRPRARALLWNPAEWDDEIELALDAPLAERCRIASADIWQNERFDEADAFVRKLAARVGKSKLPLRTTKDVVVYGVALDYPEAPETQLARQLSPARRAAFEKKKLL